ncbi:two-component system regulatory protein YycI [Paucisalibacillus globulus]|uniref:two-component system regulatory protein YycI n=1 Tax=Paucisalibacillus globulus TaxID=351095 RepID=UPI000BB710AA|nr:two-component system regulatory protein YycI [Paucisalibacillus globulus]
MQWGQIKTLFILCFLLLDIYLLSIVLEQKENEEYGYTGDQQQQVEQTLESENITVPDELPEPLPDEELITMKQKTFNEDELKVIKSKEDQEIEVINNSSILSLVKKSEAIPENATDNDIEQLVASKVYLGNEYAFENWDKDRNILIFFQTKNDRPIYYNQNGVLFVYLNDKNEIVAYTQSFLGAPEAGSDKKSLIKPHDAIMKLINSNLLYPNNEVTEVEVGYYTTYPLDSGGQVLAPTWKISIKDSRPRFVNAIQQYVVPLNEKFVEEVIESSIENLSLLKGKEEFKRGMLDILTSKQKINRSESA